MRMEGTSCRRTPPPLDRGSAAVSAPPGQVAVGARVDHAVLALEAALALRDKAALLDLPIGIGIAVGPAVVTRSVDSANVSVLGAATNLAARLQAAAAGGEILLSDDAHRRVAAWLDERGLAVTREELALKGLEGTQPAYRLAAR